MILDDALARKHASTARAVAERMPLSETGKWLTSLADDLSDASEPTQHRRVAIVRALDMRRLGESLREHPASVQMGDMVVAVAVEGLRDLATLEVVGNLLDQAVAEDRTTVSIAELVKALGRRP